MPTPGSDPALDWAAMPGIRRLVRQIGQDAVAGTSTLLIIPDPHVDSDLELAMMDLLRDEVGASDLPDGPLVASVVDAVGDDDTWKPGIDPERALVAWPLMVDRRFIVRLWRQEVGQFLRRLEALQHASEHPPQQRPAFVFLGRLGDLEAVDLNPDRLSDLHVRVRWWWGVLDRVDTESVVRVESTRLGVVEQAFIAEVAGWDVVAAARIAQGWDGRLETLHGIEGVSAEPVDVPEEAGRGSVPPKQHRSLWAAGQLDKWERRLRGPCRLPDSRTADRFMWQAQSRILFPLLEEERRSFEGIIRDVVQRQGQPWHLDVLERDMPTGEPAELSVLRRTAAGTKILGKAQWRRLVLCHAARNKLAHLETVSSEDLNHLLRD